MGEVFALTTSRAGEHINRAFDPIGEDPLEELETVGAIGEAGASFSPTHRLGKSKSEENLRPRSIEEDQDIHHGGSLVDLLSNGRPRKQISMDPSLQRSSSMADIALNLSRKSSRQASITDLTISGKEFVRQWRKHQRYVHPFGNTPTILEELFGQHDIDEFDMDQKQSPAKLMIWILCTMVLVGMAGAIVLAAETSRSDPPRINENFLNQSQTFNFTSASPM